MKSRLFKHFSIIPAALWLSVFLVIPLMIIVIYSLLERGTYGGIEGSLTLSNYTRLFDPIYLKPILKSIYIALQATLFCLAVGYPLAYFISRQKRFMKNFLLILVVLPFWTNFLARTYAWIVILRLEGLLNKLLLWLNLINQPIDILYTETTVIIGLIYGYLPFMVLPLYASIEKLDKNLIDAAGDLGATQFKTFTKIVLPLTKPGIIAGAILVFIPCLGAYITPDFLGGAKNMMIGNLIKDQFTQARDWPFGSAISFLVMAVVLISLMVYLKRIEGKIY